MFFKPGLKALECALINSALLAGLVWYKSQEQPFSVMNKGAAEASFLLTVPRCVGTFVAILMALLKLNAESFQTVD